MKQLLIIHSYFSPADNLKQIYLDFVTSAKETIRIVDYSFNMVELVDLLNKKQKEGVDVMLILDKSQEGGKRLECRGHCRIPIPALVERNWRHS